MPGTTPSALTMPAVTPIARGESKTWLRIWLPTSCSVPTRETTIAADTEISSAGTWATSASPTASRT